MKAVSRVHITPHMHWDREWYFTTEESRILLVNNMEEILCRLEQDNDQVAKNIFNSVKNVNVDDILGWHKGTERHTFLDEYNTAE